MVKELESITFSSGVTVQIKGISPYIYQGLIKKLQRDYPVPKPPIVTLHTVEGDEQQENREDPDYQQAVKEQQSNSAYALNDAMIVLGVEVPLPESDDWLDDLRYVGIEVGDKAQDRKLAYVRYVAIKTTPDMTLLTERMMGQVTATEKVVAEKVAGFPSGLPRDAD